MIEDDGRLRIDYSTSSMFYNFSMEGEDILILEETSFNNTDRYYRKGTGAKEMAKERELAAQGEAEAAAAATAAVVPSGLIGSWRVLEKYGADGTMDIRADNTFRLECYPETIGGPTKLEGNYQVDNRDSTMTLSESNGATSQIRFELNPDLFPEYGDTLILFLEGIDGCKSEFLQRVN